MPTARVKYYDADRGFGYLTPDDGSPDVVLDDTALNVTDSLDAGQHVSYELTRGSGGELRAINVVPL
ncbi:cold-shock protein [Streptomyces sp. TP-A0874]|uniref:cold-shock protein n=1 Tax=Streptomyces sp. TP-A0874 TaxID=549819 RepID=UPI0008539B46|nr:cold shock domain-containing protein [Streptomyces sp. TP-A0874]